MLDVKKCGWLCIATVACVVLPAEVFAQAAENNLTSGMMNNYRNIMQNAANNIAGLAAATFWALATIELVYSLGMKALGGGDPGEIMRSFIKRLIFIGFWGWMLTNAQNIVDAVINTMVRFAQTPTTSVTWTPGLTTPVVVGSGQQALNPDNIIDQGIQVLTDVIALLPGFGWSEIPAALAMLLAGLFIFVAMLVIAAYMALALLEVYIVGYGAVFLLALGANRHTNGYAQAYLRYLMSVGIKVFAIALIAAIGEVVMSQQIATMQDQNAGQIWATVSMAGILMILASKAPDAISGAIAGISNSSAPVSAGGLVKGATVAAAGAAGAGAALAATGAAGASAGSAASQAAGGGIGGAARGIASGVMGAASAFGKAAYGEAAEAIGGRSASNPYPRGGTAGGRMANRIKENAKSS